MKMLISRKINSITLKSFVARSNLVQRALSSTKDNDSDSDSDRETKKKQKKSSTNLPKEETAVERLNKLLASMQTDDNLNLVKDINLAKPGNNKKRPLTKNDQSESALEAVKKVTSHLGDEDRQQVESELLNKLLKGPTSSETQSAKQDKADPNELSLSELIVGMKIDRRQPAFEQSRGDYVRKTLASRPTARSDSRGDKNRARNYQKRQAEPHTGSVNLFGGKPLNIFKEPNKLVDSPDILKTWDRLTQHELKLSVTHPPANYFQKMALWTEQGKLWKFPIDNEQGLDEEAATDFSEHVFLEQHLESWCPTKGPIRHFMELVCVGLSKNPYISAKEKKAHILWFRDYFEEKKDLLKEVIVDQKDSANNPKTISPN